ncbi:secondary thiamine-phosphate synthase enzyme YjbQ [Ferrigenium sp. UT5]|uniref:secondary thiamine-phosphate synthase enzyme YjbQ n=1 Tax=Ferrigenium sp. UT5 TaxID=3242105 RepID=UPI003550AB02
MWLQREICLQPRPRGFHLVTDELLRELPELRDFRVGMMNLFIRHTSAALTLNENADPTVRQDFEGWFDRAVREDEPYYRHQDEGADDLPAHLKSSLLGASLNIPIRNGRLALGTWQGIWLCEHRNHGGSRCIVATLQGE